MANAIAGSLINLNFTEKGKVKKNIHVNVCHLYVGGQGEQNGELYPWNMRQF